MKKSIYRFSLSLISLVTFFSNAQINIYNSDGTIDSDRNVEHKDRYFNIHSYDISHFFITGSNGFVGINTTNPSERLEVIGKAKAQCLLGVNNTPSGTEDSSNDYLEKH